ncbi:hypothetical protein AC249_AIPGENE5012 [Exaiptasia diaphana]|nr:hypothetical protein AC249_AIPGENE5012 [Exaiptasia diaphana]
MPKSQKQGHKQSVDKARQRKRKNKLKGVQKQFTKAINPETREATGLTFVCDDDVMSERVPPPPPTISSRKLQKTSTEDASDEEAYISGIEKAEGYRIVSMESLRKFAIRIHSHSPCASDCLEVKEKAVDRYGMSSSIYVFCPDCEMNEFLATGDHAGLDTCPKTVQGKDVNRKIVYASNEMGISRESVSKLCEILNMPFSISKATWYSHEAALLKAHKDVAMEILDSNIREARLDAMKDQGLDVDDETLDVDIPVSFDGTWSRRGFTANHCVGFVISTSTGKGLDYEVLFKVCGQCSQKKASMSEEDYEEWQADHICQGSFTGTSGSMELESAKRIWRIRHF